MDLGGSSSIPSRSPIDRLMDRVNYERKSASPQSDAFRLDTIRTILTRLGNPQQKLLVVHIAGTKGKGSTAHYVSRIGSALGMCTGIYSSPHFERYTERFQIDNCEVSEERLNPILSKVLSVAEELDAEIESGQLDLKPATFFDISTAAAFLLFAENHVELVALEVGLGGRLDSTNVCNPVVSVITNISLDHTRQLGPTTTAIAAEKAGIIKPEIPVILGPVDNDVQSVIEQVAAKQQAPIRYFGTGFQVKILADKNSGNSSGTRFDYINPNAEESVGDIETNEIGSHQCVNASLAIAAIAEVVKLRSGQLRPDWADAVRKGVSQTTLRGRVEVISNCPLIIADMAHNEASIKALIDSLKQLGIDGKKQLLFSCCQDKDSKAMLGHLVPFFDRLILTEFQSNPRSLPLDQLEANLRGLTDSKAKSIVENLSTSLVSIADPVTAWQQALEGADEFQLTVVCGSIFLVGELRAEFRKLKANE